MEISLSTTAAEFLQSLVSVSAPNEPESQEEEAGNQKEHCVSFVTILLAALS